MDPNTEKLYTQEDVEKMTNEEKSKLLWISRREYEVLKHIEEGKRRKALDKMRRKAEKSKRQKRKAQRQARKKNR